MAVSTCVKCSAPGFEFALFAPIQRRNQRGCKVMLSCFCVAFKCIA